MSRRLVVVAAAVLVAALAAGLVLWRLLAAGGDYERALGALPDSTLRATYTHWGQVREQAEGAGLGTDASRGEVRGFLDRAFEADLVSTSALAESTYALERRYGFSPLQADWEVLGQDEEGQVVVLAFPDDVDLGPVESRLRELGYAAPPDGPGSGGTWDGGADLVAALDPELTPVQHSMAVLPEDGLVVMSDEPASVTRTVEVVRAGADSLAGLVEASVAAAGEPVSSVLWASDFACQDLAMAEADPEDQRVAEQLVDRAGGVSPLTGLVIALQPDRSMRVGLSFETSEQASENLQPRVDLAAGDAPGQGGSFADRFRVTEGEAEGETVLLRLTPRQGEDFVFSDITHGPLLFATC